ncbi:MAG: hypothetical protein KME26_19195 [Oscillatoria princeps RMCB-10]|nr:hypothetical protein [Oscillatoria princeps RMCB-10]
MKPARFGGFWRLEGWPVGDGKPAVAGALVVRCRQREPVAVRGGLAFCRQVWESGCWQNETVYSH